MADLVREIVIDATPETIWPFLTDPDKHLEWLGTDADIDPRPGGVYRVLVRGQHQSAGEYLEVVPHGEGGLHLRLGPGGQPDHARLDDGRDHAASRGQQDARPARPPGPARRRDQRPRHGLGPLPRPPRSAATGRRRRPRRPTADHDAQPTEETPDDRRTPPAPPRSTSTRGSSCSQAEKELTRLQRRPRPTASRAAVGARRQGLPLRHRGRRGHARRPVPRSLPARRVPLHVRARLGRGVPELLGGRRRLRRDATAPPTPRRRVHRRLARAARQAARVPRPHGLGASRGRRRRRATSTSTSASRSPRSRWRRGQTYNFRALEGWQTDPRTCRSKVRA